jgi:dolichol-phosphate mannosyltransferase
MILTAVAQAASLRYQICPFNAPDPLYCAGVGFDVSIVVPVRNEEENILPVTQEVSTALTGGRWSYELVFVDDASTDQTWSRILEARSRDPRVRGLRHGRNAGQSAAVWTGFGFTTSPIIATMDGDCQNDPGDFPKMLAELGSYDFVCGVRAKRQDTLIRRLSARVARGARKLVLRVDFKDTGCGMRVFQRSALEGLFPFNGFHRFFPVLAHVSGARTLQMPVNHRPRMAGQSKYGLWDRLGRGIVDLLAMAWFQHRRIPRLAIEATPETMEKVNVARPAPEEPSFS